MTEIGLVYCQFDTSFAECTWNLSCIPQKRNHMLICFFFFLLQTMIDCGALSITGRIFIFEYKQKQ